jgi:hypothetical protein
MTRVCVQCQQVLGEKCVRCGTEAVPAHADPHSDAPTRGEFTCPSCAHRFAQGDGGETGGMCQACFDEALRKAHEREGGQAMRDENRNGFRKEAQAAARPVHLNTKGE